MGGGRGEFSFFGVNGQWDLVVQFFFRELMWGVGFGRERAWSSSFSAKTQRTAKTQRRNHTKALQAGGQESILSVHRVAESEVHAPL